MAKKKTQTKANAPEAATVDDPIIDEDAKVPSTDDKDSSAQEAAAKLATKLNLNEE